MGSRTFSRLALGAALTLGLPGMALAQDGEDGDSAYQPGVFSLIVENDSLSSGNDRNYTSGFKFAYVRPTGDVPDWLSGGANILRNVTGARAQIWGVAVGQSIFTPEDIEANPAPPDQHPYAGWLYMQAMLGTVQARDDELFPRFSDLYELELGVVGPAALGEEAQSSIHQWLGAPDPQGWDSQLENEVAFALSFERRWSTWRYSTDYVPGGLEFVASPHIGATLGTLRTEARVGFTAQIGYNIINDFEIGPPRVRPSIGSAGYFEERPFAWSIFAGVQGRAVGRNLFLDGNTFVDSARVDKRTFVGDAQMGFTLQFGAARLAYTYVVRTEEFDTQTERQDFGALALQFRL